MADFKRWHQAGFTSELLPIIRVDAILAEGSAVRPEDKGKTPGKLKQDGTWVGFAGSWSNELQANVKMLQRWQGWGAGVGMQGRKFPALDIDVDDAGLSDAIGMLAESMLFPLGGAPLRYRTGSPRKLFMLKLRDGAQPLKKHRIEFFKGESKHAVELLGHGQQYVVEGPHPKGGEYLWMQERARRPLPEIDIDDVRAFSEALRVLLIERGCTLGKDMGEPDTTAGGLRKSLDDASLHAPDPALVLALLARVPPTDETRFRDRNDLVPFLCGVKAALGPTREEHRGAVLDWFLQYPASDDGYFDKIWTSITESSVGWNWLAGMSGTDVAAQADFHDGEEAPAIPDVADPEDEAIGSMLSRFVYVLSQDRFAEVYTGELHSPKAFCVLNKTIAPPGSSGRASADNIFHLAPGARNVSGVSYLPGAPILATQKGPNGLPQTVFNTWRPSQIEPVRGGAEPKPWLDHISMLFQDDGERQHFLDWCAYVLQNPGKKINHAIVLYSATHGVGKDTALYPLIQGVGEHNTQQCSPDALTSDFSPYLEGQLIVVNEMESSEKRNQYNKMKRYLADPPATVTVNKKNLREYAIPNIQNWALSTNKANAVFMEQTDRRFWVANCDVEVQTKEYFTQLWAWLQWEGGVEICVGWLLDRDVRHFNAKATPPVTDAKRDMLEYSKPVAVRWLEEQFEEEGAFRGREYLTTGEILKLARNGFEAPARVAETIREYDVIAALKKHAFAPIPKRKFRIEGKVTRLWTTGRVDLLGQRDPLMTIKDYERDQKKRAS